MTKRRSKKRASTPEAPPPGRSRRRLRPWGLAIAAGVVLGLPFAFEALQPLAWVAAVPFLYLLATERIGRGLLFTCLVGMAFLATGGYWLGHLSWFFVLACAIGWGVYYMAYAFVPLVLRRMPTLPLWAYVPLIGVPSEAIREFLSAFDTTWWALGYTQVFALPLIQISEWTGVGGVSFLLLLANAALADLVLAWARRRGWPGVPQVGPSRRRLILGTALAAALPLIATGYGRARLRQVGDSIKEGPRLLLVQGNISVEAKFQPDFAPYVLKKQVDITRQALHPDIDLVVWAETMPIRPEMPDGLEPLRSIASELRTPLVLGGLGVTVEDGLTRHANSAFHVSRDGRIQGRYDKQALVAFGEYVPLVGRFATLRLLIGRYLMGAYEGFDPFLRPGTEYTIFPLAHGDRELSVAPLICYEDVLPKMTRRFARGGADFFLLISNENYFGLREMDQHVDMAVFRAIETRRSVLRGTNTGRTCVVDPTGRVTQRLDLGVEGTLEVAAPLSDATPSSLAGQAIFPWLCALLGAIVVGAAIRRRET